MKFKWNVILTEAQIQRGGDVASGRKHRKRRQGDGRAQDLLLARLFQLVGEGSVEGSRLGQTADGRRLIQRVHSAGSVAGSVVVAAGWFDDFDDGGVSALGRQFDALKARAQFLPDGTLPAIPVAPASAHFFRDYFRSFHCPPTDNK